jgi:hypothetical protein
LWCGGGHLHKECPEQGKAESVPQCCNCTLKEGDRPHPTTYRGCRHAKEEMLRRKQHRSTPKETAGKTFTSRLTTSEQSFAAALRKGTQHHTPQQVQPAAMKSGTQTTEQEPTQQNFSGRSVSPGFMYKQFPERYVQSSYCGAADYDRAE